MVKVPVPTTFAVTLPDMVPNTQLDTMAAWAGPPRRRPVSAKATFISVSAAPVPPRTTPNTMKTRMVSRTTPTGRPNTPWKPYQTNCMV